MAIHKTKQWKVQLLNVAGKSVKQEIVNAVDEKAVRVKMNKKNIQFAVGKIEFVQDIDIKYPDAEKKQEMSAEKPAKVVVPKDSRPKEK